RNAPGYHGVIAAVCPAGLELVTFIFGGGPGPQATRDNSRWRKNRSNTGQFANPIRPWRSSVEDFTTKAQRAQRQTQRRSEDRTDLHWRPGSDLFPLCLSLCPLCLCGEVPSVFGGPG